MCRPNPLLDDDRSVVFECNFERDFCGLELKGVVYRGRRTASEDTGPDHGARYTREPMQTIQIYKNMFPPSGTNCSPFAPNAAGYFMYLEADAMWGSEAMGFDLEFTLGCRHRFDFAYYMYGANVQHIKVEGYGLHGKNFYAIIFRDGSEKLPSCSGICILHVYMYCTCTICVILLMFKSFVDHSTLLLPTFPLIVRHFYVHFNFPNG